MLMKIYYPVSWDLSASWELSLDLFCSKKNSGLDLKQHWMVIFPICDRNRWLSYHTHLWVHELWEEVFILWTSGFFFHSTAQLQLVKTWTEILVISEIKIDTVYVFRFWLWAFKALYSTTFYYIKLPNYRILIYENILKEYKKKHNLFFLLTKMPFKWIIFQRQLIF